jgi:GNAT superfamily N-acetyltransferase
MSLPPDLDIRPAAPGDEPALAALVAACDETYRAWAPPGWEPPPPGLELERWRGRITDGSWWTRVAAERDGGRIVGLVCFTQAVLERGDGTRTLEPRAGRAHVSAVFSHPDRWRQGIAAGMLAVAEEAMREAGYAEVQLWTPEQAPAGRFYEATGWRRDGRRQWLAELGLPIVAYVKPLA